MKYEVGKVCGWFDRRVVSNSDQIGGWPYLTGIRHEGDQIFRTIVYDVICFDGGLIWV